MHAQQDRDLAALQTKWDGRWKIWRANRNLSGKDRTGDYVASRIDDASGPWPTVMADTPAELDRLLADQAARAERGEKQPQP